jgi:hypothetical protein
LVCARFSGAVVSLFRVAQARETKAPLSAVALHIETIQSGEESPHSKKAKPTRPCERTGRFTLDEPRDKLTRIAPPCAPERTLD